MPNAALTLEAILVPLWVGIVGLKMCGDKAPKSRYHTWTCNTELPFSKTQQSCEYKQHQTTVTLAHILEATYETSDLSTNGSHIKGICFCVCESEESGHQVIEFRRQATELRVLFCSWSGHSTQCPMPFKLKGSSFLHVCVGCTHMLQCTHGTSLLAVMQPSLPTMGCASTVQCAHPVGAVAIWAIRSQMRPTSSNGTAGRGLHCVIPQTQRSL